LTTEGRQTVPLYTLHFFAEGDEPAGSEEIDCATDGEAINTVNERAEDRAVELWQDGRRILWWPAKRRASPRRDGARTPFNS
jgi:hypothetical protein